ncbi:hypothetical protein B296_00038796 [Ensete ventricosum]|uniref:Uncharacterized protein n=1 Tax=Ensete ventricosum TaxID=4639 RepID=A0A426ZC67_ENSVE|nr:hypothetical protein B296_00038796 [Ensete ventricosum]
MSRFFSVLHARAEVANSMTVFCRLFRFPNGRDMPYPFDRTSLTGRTRPQWDPTNRAFAYPERGNWTQTWDPGETYQMGIASVCYWEVE